MIPCKNQSIFVVDQPYCPMDMSVLDGTSLLQTWELVEGFGMVDSASWLVAKLWTVVMD